MGNFCRDRRGLCPTATENALTQAMNGQSCSSASIPNLCVVDRENAPVL